MGRETWGVSHERHDCLKFGKTWDVERVPGKFISGAGGPNEFQQYFFTFEMKFYVWTILYVYVYVLCICIYNYEVYKVVYTQLCKLHYPEEQLVRFISYLKPGAFAELCSQQSQRRT